MSVQLDRGQPVTLRDATGELTGTDESPVVVSAAAVGAVGDAAETDASQDATLVAVLKGILTILEDCWDPEAHALRFLDASP